MIRSSLLAAVLAAGMLPASALAAVPRLPAVHAVVAGDDHVRVIVRSRYDGGFGKHSDEVRGTLDTKTNAAIATSKVSDAWTLHVDVHVIKPGKYDFEVYAAKDGEKRINAIKNGCEMCLVDDLVMRVNADIAEQLAAIEKLEASAAAEPATEPDPVPPAVTPAQPPAVTDTPARKPLGALGKAGIGLIVGGVVVTGAGIGLVAAGRRFGDDELNPVNYRKPGIGVLAAGAAVLVTGVVLLAVDRTRAKQRRTVAVPFASPSSAGLAIISRF